MNTPIPTKSVQAIILGLAVGAADPVIAVQIPITNPSFESPTQSVGGFVTVATGWTVTGYGGVWYPNGPMATPPEGHHVGYINGGTFSQSLGVPLQPNTAYTLSIRVGGRNDSYVPGTNYSVSLLAGTTKLASVVPVVPPIGSWTTLTTVYNTGATVAAGNLGIEIAATPVGGGNFQFDFDLVQLDAVPLPVSPVPVITAQPANVTVAAGGAATFSVTASGTPSPSYQWYKNGAAIAGATNATFAIAAAQPADAGSYTVVATNSAGSVTSTAATLVVNYARLVNLSVRSTAGSGSQTLIVGFAISGTGSKQMLIRGIGPTLAVFNLPGLLSDPQLHLFNSGSVEINQNDNWGGGPALMSAFASVGAFALPSNSADAALLVPLPAGSYSAQVTSAAGTGVALVEGYDLDSTSSPTRLTNLSVRSIAGTDANTLIVGFAIVGNVSKTLLIRGIGPTLNDFGITGALADPQIQLFNSSSTAINQNDNWGGGASLVSTFTSVGAFGLPTNSLDAALVVTLPPGSYTAQLRGAGTSTGVALVEVYDVP